MSLDRPSVQQNLQSYRTAGDRATQRRIDRHTGAHTDRRTETAREGEGGSRDVFVVSRFNARSGSSRPRIPSAETWTQRRFLLLGPLTTHDKPAARLAASHAVPRSARHRPHQKTDDRLNPASCSTTTSPTSKNSPIKPAVTPSSPTVTTVQKLAGEEHVLRQDPANAC